MSEPADDVDTADASETATGGDPAAPPEEADERVDAHLADIDDGCGCAEVWEHLSDQRGE